MDTWVVSISMLHWMWGAGISLRSWCHFLGSTHRSEISGLYGCSIFYFLRKTPIVLFTVVHQFMFLPTVCKKFLNGPQGPVCSETCLPIPPQLISLHLTSPHLTSPHLTCMRHKALATCQGCHLASIFLFPSLDFLFRAAFLYLSLFLLSILLLYTLPSGYFSQCIYRLVFCGCFYILNNTRTLLNLSLSRRTRTVCIDPHSIVSESHTAPGPLWVLSKYLLILNENVNLFWQREERILKWVFLLKIPF